MTRQDQNEVNKKPATTICIGALILRLLHFSLSLSPPSTYASVIAVDRCATLRPEGLVRSLRLGSAFLNIFVHACSNSHVLRHNHNRIVIRGNIIVQ